MLLYFLKKLYKNCILYSYRKVCSIFKSNPIYCINLLYNVIWHHIAIYCITLYCDTILKSNVFTILFYITSVSCIFVYCNISYIWYIIFYCYCSTKRVNRFTILQYSTVFLMYCSGWLGCISSVIIAESRFTLPSTSNCSASALQYSMEQYSTVQWFHINQVWVHTENQVCLHWNCVEYLGVQYIYCSIM